MSGGARASATTMLCAVAVVLTGGCGHGTTRRPDGSTLTGTFRDRHGLLERGPGEPLRARSALGPLPRGPTRELARIALLADAHVRDEESPGRAPFLDRLGNPFTSTFRPQEALTAQVLVAAVRALRRERPQALVELGDLADSAQENEFAVGVAGLRGGVVTPDSGAEGYAGVQDAGNPDPFYYRPDVDAPRHPGLMNAAQRPFRSPGIGVPWYPVLGNHDALVDGEVAATPTSNAIATGTRLLETVDPRTPLAIPRQSGRLAPAAVAAILRRGIPGRALRVAPDPLRRELTGDQAVARLRGAAHAPGRGPRLQYAVDIGPRVRLIVLDIVRRRTGSGGLVTRTTRRFLARALSAAREREVIVATHQPLATATGGPQALALLDRDPHVIAALNGHVHRNAIALRRTRLGGYWLIGTASLADFPEQTRMLSLVQDRSGHLALETWVVDQDGRGLAGTSRELAYLDAQGGRPSHFAGSVLDRNAMLSLPPASAPAPSP